MPTTSHWATGAYLVACALLAWAGLAKLRRPHSTGRASAAVGLPATPGAVRTFGGVELTLGVAGIVLGGLAAVGVAACYGFLAVVAWRLARRAPATPCGCLGGQEAPASVSHVAVDVLAALCALAAAGNGVPLSFARDRPALLLATTFAVVTAVALLSLALEALPELARLTRGGSAP